MADFTAGSGSFKKLNGILGIQMPPIPYCWNGSDVLLKSGKFDEKLYIDSKFEALRRRAGTLSSEDLLEVFQKVVTDNKNIFFEMQACTQEQFQRYDEKFNLLIESAVNHAENEQSLRISKENIKNSFQISDSWMTPYEVNRLMRLTQNNPAEAPDPRKFVPKHRR